MQYQFNNYYYQDCLDTEIQNYHSRNMCIACRRLAESGVPLPAITLEVIKVVADTDATSAGDRWKAIERIEFDCVLPAA